MNGKIDLDYLNTPMNMQEQQRMKAENWLLREEIKLTKEWMAKDDEGKRQHRHNMPLNEFIGLTRMARLHNRSFWFGFDAKWIEEVEKHDKLLEDALENNDFEFPDLLEAIKKNGDDNPSIVFDLTKAL
tara:strand:+ start:8184 stop:8570 length:387 start_codon:yes stop_codon:yes gene_type:complete